MAQITQNSLVGAHIGKYRIEALLGRGGMAEVYRAYQENLDRHVAIKLLYPFLVDEENFVQRFQREARAMAAIDHPHIIDVYDFDVIDHRPFIVMQYLAGGTLHARQQRVSSQGKRLPLSLAIQTILQVSDALAHAHSFGMIHRDIKPGNIMFSEWDAAVLTDFGIVRMLRGTSHTTTGTLVGTPAYMAPEQGLGEPGDERSDLYALGVVFYGMVTGVLPFDAESPVALVMKHVREPVNPPALLNGELPRPIEDVILKMLAKAPSERYQSATDLARGLTEAVFACGDERLLGEIPAAVLRERHTPPAGTRASLAAEAARSTADLEADDTRLLASADLETAAPDRTEIDLTIDQVEDLAGAAAVKPARFARVAGRRAWLLLVVLLLCAGVGLTWRAGRSGTGRTEAMAAVSGPEEPVRDAPGAAAVLPVAAAAEKGRPPATKPAAVPTQAATATLPAPTMTATRRPTATIEPPTPTVDPTAAFLADCRPAVSFDNIFTYGNPETTAAPAGARLVVNWVLSRPTECPWPAGLRLVHLDGENFGLAAEIQLPAVPSAGETLTLRTEKMRAPERPGRYPSRWGLVDGQGKTFGAPVAFAIEVYRPATPTPAALPTKPAPTATNSGGGGDTSAQPLGFNVFFSRCEYPGGGSEYRCEMLITPFGGPPGPYTIFVFDREQPARYFGGNQTHFISSRRCAPWVHEIKVQSEASGESFSRNIYFNPAAEPLFSGGTTCTES